MVQLSLVGQGRSYNSIEPCGGSVISSGCGVFGSSCGGTYWFCEIGEGDGRCGRMKQTR